MKERADIVFGLLAEDAIEAIVGVCRSFIEFREYRLESNPSMAPAAEWWECLCAASKVVISQVKTAVESLDRKYAWLENQAAPTLAMLCELEGSVGDALGRLIDSGHTRLKPKHLAMMEHARTLWSASGACDRRDCCVVN